jgi:hypothetical protein
VLALGVGITGLCLWTLVSEAAAPPRYIPDGPDVPAIVLNEGQSREAGLPPLKLTGPALQPVTEEKSN